MKLLPRRWNSWLVPCVVLALGLGSGLAITTLYRHAEHSRAAQLRISSLRLQLNSLFGGAFRSDARAGGSPEQSAKLIASSNAIIRSDVKYFEADGSAPRALDGLAQAVEGVYPWIRAIVAIGSSPEGFNGSPQTDRVLGSLFMQRGAIERRLDVAAADYDRTARSDRTRAEVGSLATLMLLLAAFLLLYARSGHARSRAERLARENERLAQASHDDAITDELTGLGNRRGMTQDLEARLASRRGAGAGELVFAMYDLDGFKQYNDTFGHGAGDALLARLGERLASTMGAEASTYRMGGDEFCIVGAADAVDGHRLVDAAAQALSDAGDGWKIGCSYGVARIPSQAATIADALRVADERMYANKASRSSASRQTVAALVQVLTEQGDGLDDHAGAVADLSVDIAEQLDIPSHEVQHIRLAAELHDIGKAAIPNAILNKPGPLDDAEWAFIRRHTLIGERIVLAAPTLDQVAKIVRSSHERVDGAGYPDGLAGDAIPIGSRIIAVADAYHAMVSARPYGQAVSPTDAIAELERCAGTQFDPEMVTAFRASRLAGSSSSGSAVLTR